MLPVLDITDPAASSVPIVPASGQSVDGPRRTGRIRPVQPQPIPLVNMRLAVGEPIVPADGNLSPGYLLTKRVLDITGALALLAAQIGRASCGDRV